MFRIVIAVLLSTNLQQAKSSVNLNELTREFYAALNKGDSIDLLPFFHPECHVKHLGVNDVWDLSLIEFIGVCPKFKSDYYSEDIARMEVHAGGDHPHRQRCRRRALKAKKPASCDAGFT